ncbi:MAG: hypothetical protein A2V88_11685 [Elusimicrobia bacterium RBG_16_66_12]|nr:MAG: hypothetical protein A2V88_11685 [Elusimicrobia bacterium RBG_16_66_12]
MRRYRALAVLACLLFSPAAADAKTRLKDLLRRFEGGKLEDRLRLAPALGRAREKKAVDALLGAFDIRRGNPRETTALVDALGRAGDPRAVESLVGAWDYLRSMILQMELPGHLQALRWKILEALSRLGGDQAVGILSESLNDKDPRVVEEAVRGLGRLQVKAAVPALLELSRGAAAGNLTQAVIEALGEIGDKRAVSVLEQAVKSGDKFVEVEATYALARLGQKEMAGKLSESLKSDPGAEKVGILAAYYLAKLDRAAGLDHLEKLMKRSDGGYAALAAETLGKSENPRAVLPLIEAAKSEDSSLRLSVARSLGRLGGTRALSALKQLRDDPNPGVRNAAISSLADLGELD